MKNTKVLKDELGILTADRSAVIIELSSLGKSLKELHSEIDKAEKNLADVKDETLLETARRDDMRSRAISLGDEVSALKQELNTLSIKTEVARTKNAQETKLHLGRIKELNEEIETLRDSLEELKETYDRNTRAMNLNFSDLNTRYRDTNEQAEVASKELAKITKEVDSLKEEEKRITKERLKREDKVRAREKSLERRERGLEKREEDVKTFASDLTIIYYRLKEAYPDIDIDKLIKKVT